MDFGAIRPDRRDVAKLLVIDFMLIHGNDWFVIPVAQPVGTLCHVRSLIVHDVFGDLTLIERADAGAALGGPRWTLFSTSVEGDPAQLASFFLLPPSASIAAEASPPLEEIRFLRDDMANLVWAIEHTTENGVGQPWLGSERDRAVRPAPVTPSPAAAPREPDRPPLRYRLQTTVPTHWIPFLPVAIDRPQGDIALERGVMLRSVLGASAQPTEPVGRILRPTTLGLTPYRIREEEVPRSGVRILRVACRSRWTDGSTYLWLSRRKTAGAGEGRSGLRFDIAERNK